MIRRRALIVAPAIGLDADRFLCRIRERQAFCTEVRIRGNWNEVWQDVLATTDTNPHPHEVL